MILTDSQADKLTSLYDSFARLAWGIQLRPYQLLPARAVLRAFVEQSGDTIVTVMPRQSGKSELLVTLPIFVVSSVLPGIPIGTYSPTFLQVRDVLMRRARARLSAPIFQGKWKLRGQNLVEFSYSQKVLGPYAHMGPGVLGYYSADPAAAKRGPSWAGLLLDEAQDMLRQVIDEDLSPTVAAFNGLTWYCFTPWSVDSKVYDIVQGIKHHEIKGSVFEYTWKDVSRVFPAYERFVERQKRELGESSIAFRTNFGCEWIPGLGLWFDWFDFLSKGDEGVDFCEVQPAFPEPGIGCYYVGGLDIAGGGSDMTAIVIRRIVGNVSTLVFCDQWREPSFEKQIERLKKLLLVDWPNLSYLVTDATGLGYHLSQVLDQELPWTNVEPVVFTESLKSEIGTLYDYFWSRGQIRYAYGPRVFLDDGKTLKENLSAYFHQARWLVREAKKSGKLNWFVRPDHGHDDLMTADFLSIWGMRHLVEI